MLAPQTLFLSHQAQSAPPRARLIGRWADMSPVLARRPSLSNRGPFGSARQGPANRVAEHAADRSSAPISFAASLGASRLRSKGGRKAIHGRPIHSVSLHRVAKLPCGDTAGVFPWAQAHNRRETAAVPKFSHMRRSSTSRVWGRPCLRTPKLCLRRRSWSANGPGREAAPTA